MSQCLRKYKVRHADLIERLYRTKKGENYFTIFLIGVIGLGVSFYLNHLNIFVLFVLVLFFGIYGCYQNIDKSNEEQDKEMVSRSQIEEVADWRYKYYRVIGQTIDEYTLENGEISVYGYNYIKFQLEMISNKLIENGFEIGRLKQT